MMKLRKDDKMTSLCKEKEIDTKVAEEDVKAEIQVKAIHNVLVARPKKRKYVHVCSCGHCTCEEDNDDG